MARSHTPSASRRAVLGASAGLLAAPAAMAGEAPAMTPASTADAEAILARYQGFGIKASGGPGDIATGEWLEGELQTLGYVCRRQPFETPAYEGGPAVLTSGALKAELIPQAIVQATGPGGVSGPLFLAGSGAPPAGRIALMVLPYARWSTIKGEVERRVRAVFQSGAAAVVLVTTGPTGEALALNTPVDEVLFDRPVAILSPRDAEPFVRAAQKGEPASLVIPGRSFRRPAFNVTARLSRGHAKSLILSTPRSGWFTCAGERGTGLAAWLLLARWAAKANLPFDLALVATSGHEYEYAGGETFIRELAPKPKDTVAWVHLGANVAARDWHERGPMLAPLPSADPQRFLLASPALVPHAKAAFGGLPGLEQVYTADPKQAAGELASILAGGYDPVIGVFGSHRFHHARTDDLRCTHPPLIPPVVDAFKTVIGALQKVA